MTNTNLKEQQKQNRDKYYEMYITDKNKFFGELFQIAFTYQTLELLLAHFDFIEEKDWNEVEYLYNHAG